MSLINMCKIMVLAVGRERELERERERERERDRERERSWIMIDCDLGSSLFAILQKY